MICYFLILEYRIYYNKYYIILIFISDWEKKKERKKNGNFETKADVRVFVHKKETRRHIVFVVYLVKNVKS